MMEEKSSSSSPPKCVVGSMDGWKGAKQRSSEEQDEPSKHTHSQNAYLAFISTIVSFPSIQPSISIRLAKTNWVWILSSCHRHHLFYISPALRYHVGWSFTFFVSCLRVVVVCLLASLSLRPSIHLLSMYTYREREIERDCKKYFKSNACNILFLFAFVVDS